MRLSPDMFNLARQVRAAIDHAANALALTQAFQLTFGAAA
jgi:hypothetical protein